MAIAKKIPPLLCNVHRKISSGWLNGMAGLEAVEYALVRRRTPDEIPLSLRMSMTIIRPTSPREEKQMRMLLRVSIPVEAGNAAAKAGTLGSTIDRILADLKPEAVYFFADDNGNRSGSIVFDMKDSSQIPSIAEPWFQTFGATVSLRPVMNPQDLAKAGASIGKAAKLYGS